MRVLLIQPPMTQLNTPYPATAFLAGHLKSQGIHVAQVDLAIDLINALYSRTTLSRIIDRMPASTPPTIANLRHERDRYLDTVEPAIRFLQGKDPTLALRIASRHYLPEGPRFAAINPFEPGQHQPSPGDDESILSWAFGSLGIHDRASYLATLYVEDIADAIQHSMDARFSLARYAEKLAASAPTFDALQDALHAPPTLIDSVLAELTETAIRKHRPTVVGLSVPFPGNVYAAFRIAATLRRVAPRVKIALGGGYVNTELRSLSDPRVFDYVDYVALDDGESSFAGILAHIRAPRNTRTLQRTFTRQRGKVTFHTTAHPPPPPQAVAPTYTGLDLGQYWSVFEMLNPMHRIWSDGRWNKLMLAHGCYWSRCTFCDTSLDYINRYEPRTADRLVDHVETIIAETGQTGFHFVDEAAPPALMKSLARRLIERKVAITWWTNVRFDRAFTPDTCALLAQSGCVAVSGGLEVAEDRLLALMQKGVSVDQVARVTHAFSEAGIMVHAYLMYGFPSQTTVETVDALEMVRQLFQNACIQSGYWHRFALTIHSPVYRQPNRYGIVITPGPAAPFANNEVSFVDPVGVDHAMLGQGLRRALFNYMHGVGLDQDVRTWFDLPVPRTRITRRRIARALA